MNDLADRAFADANLRLAWARTQDAGDRRLLVARHLAVVHAARDAHATLRAEIASGALRGAALRRVFDAYAPLERDHFVEEVLGVAYPPLEESVLGRDLVSYTPSGYEEIVHALDVTKLAPGNRLLDIGSGMGKVALLAALLCGASAAGIECEPSLVDLARAAAADLGASLGALDVRFDLGDARTAALSSADVVFMYVPFTGEPFAEVMQRVTAMRPHFICCAPLDLERRPGLVPVGAPCSWLQVYSSA